MPSIPGRLLCASALAALFSAALAQASSFAVTATFDSTITSDPNATSIEGVINSAIGVYESAITNAMNVNILFQEEISGLGNSSYIVDPITYSQFVNGLSANVAIDHGSMATAYASLPSSGSPVGNSTNMLIHSADAKAVGLASALYISPTASDGTVSINTSITNPGTGAGGNYSLLTTVEHEIDEVLGLGSTLGQGYTGQYANYASPEDLYRYSSANHRNFTTSGTAWFSIDGTHMLTKFDNTGSGDYGDWLGVANSPQVQDANGTQSANAVLGTNELLALNAIGYDLSATPSQLVAEELLPEPSTWLLFGAGLLAVAWCRYTCTAS